MPFVFLIVGAVFVVSGALGTSPQFLTLLKGDLLSGKNSFLFWILSIFIIGSLGYVSDLRGFSRALLALVLIVLVIEEDRKSSGGGGFFVKFQDAIGTITGKAAA